MNATEQFAATPGEDYSNLALLASALASRDLAVMAATPGELSWTDGHVIYITQNADRSQQLQQLCVQSALIASGSFERAIMEYLVRRPKHARRYLALEAKRSLLVLNDLLPPAVRKLGHSLDLPQTLSATDSLTQAKHQSNNLNLPACIGELRPKALLKTLQQEGGAAGEGTHQPRSKAHGELQELAEDANEDQEDSEDSASSPVGGGGGLGKILKNLFEQVRRIAGEGAPGADTPTHWSRSGPRAGVRAVQSSTQVDSIEDAFGRGSGYLYPEWHLFRGHYRMDWCTVHELPAPTDQHANVEWLDGIGLKKPIARLGMGLDNFHRQPQGDDLDIDALIEAQIEVAAGTSVDENVYIESQRHRRDLSVLVLLDISGSVSQTGQTGTSVHQQQRKVAAALTTVLHEIGDRVSLFAFHSQGRHAVHLVPVKRFAENLDSTVMNRLHSLKPGAYSRLGAAIRHGSTVLIDESGTPRKLLIVLSDGLAYDHGYEPEYGAADARQALAEARRDGVGCVCLSVSSHTDTQILKQVFGSAAHATVSSPQQIARLIGPLFRAALRSAESQRRTATNVNPSNSETSHAPNSARQ